MATDGAERAVAVVADALEWLTDSRAEIFAPGEHEVERLGEVLDRVGVRLLPIRKSLMTMQVGHPSEKIRNLSWKLEDALTRTYGRYLLFVQAAPSPTYRETEAQGALVVWTEARQFVDELAEAIRQT